ncbi:MAG: hypothetical protein WDN26_09480 [Chitinophagaceae bacterium]
MPASKDFSEYYKTITNTELLDILENADDYQPEAIHSANEEFANRKLSDNEINEVKETLTATKIRKEKQRQKGKEIEEKIKNAGNNVLESLNPIQSGIPSTEKIIRFIIAIFGILFLFWLLKDFGMYRAMLQDFNQYPFTTSLLFLPIVILPIALILFWKRKNIGWHLLTIFMLYTTVGILWMLLQFFLRKNSGNYFFDSFFPQTTNTSLGYSTYLLQWFHLFNL